MKVLLGLPDLNFEISEPAKLRFAYLRLIFRFLLCKNRNIRLVSEISRFQETGLNLQHTFKDVSDNQN